MFKKIAALFAVAAMLLSLAACGENTELFASGDSLEPDAVGSYIAQAVAAKYEMKTVCTYGGREYKAFEYNDKQVLARIEKSGNVLVLFEYPLDTKIEYDLEATKRSGKYIYFTKQDSGAQYSSLCAVYLPTNTQMTVVDTPCSNMVLLDAKKDNKMYNYGIIVRPSQIAVIDLAKGAISSYSRTPSEIATYIDVGEAFFSLGNFGAYTEAVVEKMDEDHVIINVIEKNSKGEVKSEFNFTFNPSNGVASF